MSGETFPSIAQLRDAIVEYLRANLPGVKSVEAHGGTFDLDEVKRHAVAAPCLRICIAGTGDLARHSSGAFMQPVNVACVIFTKDQASTGTKRVSRDQAALALAGAVDLLIAGYRFNLEGVWPPENIKGSNEFSGALDKMGVALWQITWEQSVLLGETRDEAIAALSQVWINGSEFNEGIEPDNDAPLGNPIDMPAPGVPQAPQPGEAGDAP